MLWHKSTFGSTEKTGYDHHSALLIYSEQRDDVKSLLGCVCTCVIVNSNLYVEISDFCRGVADIVGSLSGICLVCYRRFGTAY
jgi:hypothetical protein